MSLVRISESDDWIVDYDTERGMYRVSYFEDNHFVDEHWFDAYKEDEVSLQKAINARAVTLSDVSYNAKDCTFEQIKNAIDDFNRMCAESMNDYKEKCYKDLYEEQMVKMLTNWDKD